MRDLSVPWPVQANARSPINGKEKKTRVSRTAEGTSRPSGELEVELFSREFGIQYLGHRDRVCRTIQGTTPSSECGANYGKDHPDTGSTSPAVQSSKTGNEGV